MSRAEDFGLEVDNLSIRFFVEVLFHSFLHCRSEPELFYKSDNRCCIAFRVVTQYAWRFTTQIFLVLHDTNPSWQDSKVVGFLPASLQLGQNFNQIIT